MGGLVYLLFTKLVSIHADILDQLKSNFNLKDKLLFFSHIPFNLIII